MAVFSEGQKGTGALVHTFLIAIVYLVSQIKDYLDLSRFVASTPGTKWTWLMNHRNRQRKLFSEDI